MHKPRVFALAVELLIGKNLYSILLFRYVTLVHRKLYPICLSYCLHLAKVKTGGTLDLYKLINLYINETHILIKLTIFRS